MLKISFNKNYNVDDNFDEITALYSDVGWTSYVEQPNTLKEGIKKSLYKEYAFVDKELVGLIRAIGDEKTIIYIQDIIIVEKYQRNGIGTSFLKNLFAYYKNVRQIILSTENTEKTKKIYKSVGMAEMKNVNCTSFILKKL